MANILVSGLINTETTVRVRQFPVNYYPIDYPFFGVNTAVSGVAYNISKARRDSAYHDGAGLPGGIYPEPALHGGNRNGLGQTQIEGDAQLRGAL